MISKDAKYFISVIAARYGNDSRKTIDLHEANDLAELARLEGALEMLDMVKPYIINDETDTAYKNYDIGVANLATYKKQLEEKYNFLFPVKNISAKKKRSKA